MCGFAGFLRDKEYQSYDRSKDILQRMNENLALRGPDDSGIWYDDNAGIGLGHRRLSIQDLSDLGHQPMISECGRYALVFNGEIYNHLLLRKELNLFSLNKDLNTKEQNINVINMLAWRGRSDTETLLACFSAWGVRATIERCIGMFAFAMWDKKKRTLTLGRDRMGEKPLYYGWQKKNDESCFLFGSDLKALKAHKAFNAEINRDALSLMMRYGYIPEPYSIYSGIYKLSPGHILSVSLDKKEPLIESYWSHTDVAISGAANPFKLSEEQIVDDLDSLLKSAVNKQMIGDVPLGAFLSGGIDSSIVVAMMQEQSSQPVKTFTIGFSEKRFNEAIYAKAVAKHLGTDHEELYILPKQALDIIPLLPNIYSEPFADPSQIPTFLVSQLARQQVKVVLSGDGGDELFAGYNRYIFGQKLWNVISCMPFNLRVIVASFMRLLPSSTWESLLSAHPAFNFSLGNKFHKIAELLCAPDFDEMYLKSVSHWDFENFVIGAKEPSAYLRNKLLKLSGMKNIQRMMAFDVVTYLADDILVKLDRASMGVSLETRAPFLDHRVVEFASRIPQSMNVRKGIGKRVLRQVLHRYMPKELVDRPKVGFGVPIDSWLRGPLRDWAESLLNESRLREQDFFNVSQIREKWNEHLSGKFNWQNHLWNVLMFQAWLDVERRQQ